jgi:hypothetical protein
VLGPLLLIVIGVLFLLNNMYPGVYRFSRMWPVILIVIGLSKVIEYFQTPKQSPETNTDTKPETNTDTKKENQ